MIKAVLLDLDGTLADTAPDLAYALNQVLIQNNRKPLPLSDIREVASHGSAPLIYLGFGDQLEEQIFEAHRQQLLNIYSENIARETTLMGGMEDLLLHLDRQNIPWGVVTNKPARFTDPLIEQLGLSQRASCIISGDTTDSSKPHPKPLLHACELLNLSPEQCIYVGDASRDIEAGNRAEMTTIAARFGYLSSDDKITEWCADGIIDHPSEILNWLSQ
ncbi:MAG: HAD-IA family hydrolase [Gammaproteobacteria bacterium]|uniref:HAD-IA family hydrolase n=1 Tax=Candidatus Thiopontia autotrophica TaxID=2841688 RepID=A0A8J6TRZ5_9GAMM|nr:HAD-IA family hydrolase [Candidatus Thiopontia autotrophica]MBL6969753.1 HAD-IA family hydrolase [Gammaproteobacteria bacterium]